MKLVLTVHIDDSEFLVQFPDDIPVQCLENMGAAILRILKHRGASLSRVYSTVSAYPKPRDMGVGEKPNA